MVPGRPVPSGPSFPSRQSPASQRERPCRRTEERGGFGRPTRERTGVPSARRRAGKYSSAALAAEAATAGGGAVGPVDLARLVGALALAFRVHLALAAECLAELGLHVVVVRLGVVFVCVGGRLGRGGGFWVDFGLGVG